MLFEKGLYNLVLKLYYLHLFNYYTPNAVSFCFDWFKIAIIVSK